MSEETIEETAEATEMVKVKFLREVNYKGVGFAKGVEANLESHVAERQIAEGHAIEVEAKAKKGETADTKE